MAKNYAYLQHCTKIIKQYYKTFRWLYRDIFIIYCNQQLEKCLLWLLTTCSRWLGLQYLVGGEVLNHTSEGSFPGHRDCHVVDRLSELRDIQEKKQNTINQVIGKRVSFCLNLTSKRIISSKFLVTSSGLPHLFPSYIVFQHLHQFPSYFVLGDVFNRVRPIGVELFHLFLKYVDNLILFTLLFRRQVTEIIRLSAAYKSSQ